MSTPRERYITNATSYLTGEYCRVFLAIQNKLGEANMKKPTIFHAETPLDAEARVDELIELLREGITELESIKRDAADYTQVIEKSYEPAQ